MNLKLSLMCAGTLVLIAHPRPAHAQDAATGTGGWSLGLGAAATNSPYKGYDQDVIPVPIVAYEGESFYARGVEVGYHLLKGEHSALDIKVSLLPLRFRHEDTDDVQLKRLDQRDMSGLAGVGWSAKGDWGKASISLQGDISGHGGYLAEGSYGYPIRMGRAVLTPAVGVTHMSEEIADYYYGISTSESIRSGLPAYQVDAVALPYAEISLGAALGQRWTLFGSVRRTTLDDEIQDSPMVGSEHLDTATVGVGYRFR